MEEEFGTDVNKATNYKSRDGHREEVEALFRKEEELCWMVEMSDKEAKEAYGDRLFVAALAVVEEPGKIRVVHDGMNGVHVNNRIRPRDQTRSPGAGELRQLLRECATKGSKAFVVAGDVSKARKGRPPQREGRPSWWPEEPYRMLRCRSLGTDLGMAFRADANAEGQVVCVWGWECIGGTPPERARWFSLRLDRRSAPWAFAQGEPFRATAALELFATLLCIMVFGGAWPSQSAGTIGLTGITDNSGDTFAPARLMTSKFPMFVILAEFAVQIRRRSLELDFHWVPRDQIEEADALTNEEFGASAPERRVRVDLEGMWWELLPRMLEAAEDLYRQVQERSTQGRSRPPEKAKRAPAEKLRAREPW